MIHQSDDFRGGFFFEVIKVLVVSKFFYLHHYLGEDFQFDKYLSDGLVQPPTREFQHKEFALRIFFTYRDTEKMTPYFETGQRHFFQPAHPLWYLFVKLRGMYPW